MLDIFRKLGDSEKAEKLFVFMKSSGNLDSFSYNAMISMYTKSGNLPKSLKYFDEMRESGIKPEILAFNVIIALAGKLRDPRLVNFIRAIMKKEHVLPNLVTYNTLINFYFSSGKQEEGAKVLQEMRERGIRGDEVTQRILKKNK
jgi:pentatricopeptide repeat protein